VASGGDSLDDGYRAWVDSLTTEERAAVLAWQRADDRRYAAIQAPFREGSGPASETTRREIRILDALIERAALPMDVQAWKGVRSVKAVFGKSAADLRPGDTVRYDGFFAASTDRCVAVGEFAIPPGAPRAGVLRMQLARGLPFAWISGAGAPAMRYQRELLAADGVRSASSQIARETRFGASVKLPAWGPVSVSGGRAVGGGAGIGGNDVSCYR
jgi:hypothetical protein